jgi:Tol biopolymer transport system component
LCRKPSDGSGTEEKLFTDDHQIVPTDWSPDGKVLVFERAIEAPKAQIWTLPLEGDRKPRMVLDRAAGARLSPDSRWLAYHSGVSGQLEVYVVPFAGGQGKWQVSAAGGMYPEWSRDGKEIYYMDLAGNLLEVSVKEIGGALQFGSPQTLVSKWTIVNQPLFDVAPDGKKILLDRVAQQVTQPLTVVTNWTTELKK